MTVRVRAQRALGALAVVALAVVVSLAAVPPGRAAAAPDEAITGYDVRMQVYPDGSMRVTETIRYAFGPEFRHGIYRRIPVRFRYDDTRDRVYPVDGVTVTMDGRPTPVLRSAEGAYDSLRIGDPDDLDSFSRYLPYAMVFGIAEQWTAMFADLAATPSRGGRPGLYWYGGRPGWTMAGMYSSIDRFGSTTADTITATPPSTSSSSGGSSGGSSGFSGGYSGGGGGGGGGGSW
jgi:uncharacterized membrane protein YgcG